MAVEQWLNNPSYWQFGAKVNVIKSIGRFMS
jgi:hypothetical protein